MTKVNIPKICECSEILGSPSALELSSPESCIRILWYDVLKNLSFRFEELYDR